MQTDDAYVRMRRLREIRFSTCAKRGCGQPAVANTRLCSSCIAASLKAYVAECGESGLEKTNLYAIEAICPEAKKRAGVKFGISSDPKARVAILQTGSAMNLSLYGQVPCASLLERNIHSKLRRHRINGEWFRPCGTVYEVMEMIRRKQIKKLYDFCGLARLEFLLVA